MINKKIIIAGRTGRRAYWNGNGANIKKSLGDTGKATGGRFPV